MFEEIYVRNEEWKNEINMNKVNNCMSLLFFLTVNPLMGKSIDLYNLFLINLTYF